MKPPQHALEGNVPKVELFAVSLAVIVGVTSTANDGAFRRFLMDYSDSLEYRIGRSRKNVIAVALVAVAALCSAGWLDRIGPAWLAIQCVAAVLSIALVVDLLCFTRKARR